MGRQRTHTREAGEKQERAPGMPGWGGFTETFPCAQSWLSTSTTSADQWERRDANTVLLPWGQTSWVPQDPSAVLVGGMLGPKSPQSQQGSVCCAGGTGGGRAVSREGRRNAWGRRPNGAPERATLPANEVGACERARAENPRRAHQAPCLR